MSCPFGIRWNPSYEPGNHRKKEERSKSRPDNLTSLLNTINLSQNITDDVGERKDDCPTIEDKWSYIDELYTRDIRDDESGDEESGDNREHEYVYETNGVIGEL